MAVSRVNQSPSQSVQSSETSSAKRTDRSSAAGESHKAERGSAPATGEGARAEISARAREMSKVKDVAASTPDVREDRVADLKRRIQAGTYQVDSDAIADRMIQDHASF